MDDIYMDGKVVTEERLRRVAELLRENKKKNRRVNEEKAQAVHSSIKTLKDIINEDEVQITERTDDYNLGMEFVSIVGEKIVVNDPKQLSEIIRESSNIEFISRTDQQVEMNLTYNGLLVDEE